MRLNMFRKKLAYEIKEIETIIQNSNYANQEVQAHIYCIAALLRRIMSRLRGFRKYEISIVVGEEENIKLKNLTDKILHYSYFKPGDPFILRTIRILSEKEEDSNFREIEVIDFIEIAKKIATDDDTILFHLLNYTKEKLGKVIYAPSVKQFDKIEARESLIDFFELAQKMDYENWPSGKITLFHEQRENMKSIMEVTGIQTYEIGYDILFQKLFNEWHFTLVGGQFYP